MPRLKRSQKGTRVRPEPAVAPPTRVTERIYGALCPVCGKTIIDRAVKVGYVSVGRTPYFETIDWDPNKPFGVSFAAGGKGSFKDREYIGPEDAPELFEQVKKRFLDALGEWLGKGWITEEEVREVLSYR